MVYNDLSMAIKNTKPAHEHLWNMQLYYYLDDNKFEIRLGKKIIIIQSLLCQSIRTLLYTFFNHLLFSVHQVFNRVSKLQEIITNMEFELVTMQNKPRTPPFV